MSTNISHASAQLSSYLLQAERLKLPQLLFCIFFMMILWQLYLPLRVYWQAQKFAQTASQPMAVIAAPVVSTTQQSGFGDYAQGQLQLPITTLPIKLQGLGAASSAQAPGWALISDQQGNTTSYSIGGQVAGATITQIDPQQVVLRNAGRLERLVLNAPEVKPNVPILDADTPP